MECKIKNCDRKHIARGWCTMHYIRWRRTGEPGEANPRKKPNGTYAKYINGKKVWNSKEDKEFCIRNQREYREMRRKEDPNYGKSIKSMHKERFGGRREAVLKRDDYTCQLCGMTNEEHKEEWDKEITIDHKDMTGRYSDKHNNDIDNLWTLCLRCHGKKDCTYKYIKNNKLVPEKLQGFVQYFI